MKRRDFAVFTGLGVLGLSSLANRVAAQTADTVIKIGCKKFEFNPNTIALKKGVPVILEFTTEDVVMGFNAPDFGVRATIVPGMATRLRLMPDKVGSFAFFCDVFCGSGHEDMNGTLTVVA
jgi:cytochrome c oxidase subunit 2